jgi:hypothetical protein
MLTVVAAAAITAGPWATAGAGERLVWSIDGSIANSGLPAGIAPGVALGPNVSASKDGARIEIAGSGTFTPSGSIDGSGMYRIVDGSGRVLATGGWRPAGRATYTDLGTEPEGSPVERLRAGVIVVRIAMDGFGRGRLTFLCGAHSPDGEELEGVKVTGGGRRFHRIEEGSTTIERP